MKIKTKLIASIMSICLVCAVFAIGVFALKTANLKIGGDVSFTAIGVEASITNANISGMKDASANSDFKMAADEEISIDTSMTQTEIDTAFATWQGLDLEFADDATDIVLTFDIKNDSTNADHYIEIDYDYSFTNNVTNVDVFPAEANDYILEPNAGSATKFALIVRVLNKEVNVAETTLNITIVLKHTEPVDSTNWTFFEDSSAPGEMIVTGYSGELKEGNILEIPVVIKDSNTRYLVNSIQSLSSEPENTNFSSDIEDVIIHNNIKFIDGTFIVRNHTKITKIDFLPNSLTKLGGGVFLYSNAKSVILPNGLKEIGNASFSFSAIEEISLPKMLAKINSFSFQGTALDSVLIPANVETIGFGAFMGSGITSVVFEDATGWVANGQSLDLSNPQTNATYLKSTYASYDWTKTVGSVVSVVAENVNASISNASFTGMASSSNIATNAKIESTMIKEQVDSQFATWKDIELEFNENKDDIEFSFNIENDSTNPDDYIEIDYSFSTTDPNVGVFPGDENAQGVWENNNYILAPKGSAKSATSEIFTLKFRVLDKELNVPENTKVNLTIALKHVTPKSATATDNIITIDNVQYYLRNSGTAYVIDHKITTAGTAAVVHPVVMSDAEGAVPCIVREIGGFAFSSCKSLTSITIPSSVTMIYSYAFSGCTGLTSITIPNSVTFIDMEAFSDCTGLTSITIQTV